MNRTFTKSMTLRCLLALALLAILSTGAHLILRRNISSQQTNAAVVNAGGRQRMLSQQAALLSLRLVSSREQAERNTLRRALLDVVSLMERSHEGLVKGDPNMNLPGKPSPEVRAMYLDPPILLDTQVNNYLAEAKALAHAPDGELTRDNSHMRYILAAAHGELLDALDTVVRQYQVESEVDNARLQRLDRWVLIATLFALLVTALFVFRPMVRLVHQEMVELNVLNGTLEQRVAEGTAAAEQRAEELARSNAELQQFVYVASHHLQEPLRMVASYTQLLGQRYKGKLDADADEFISYAVDGANRMQQLINDFLSFSRVGMHGKDFYPTDCATVLDQTLINLEAAIKESGAVISHDALPIVMADASQIGQLFQNLIGNAIKFHGEERPEVRVDSVRKNGNWVFSVRDNGIGINPQYADRIFGVFQQLHRQGQYPGTGIGLAICKKIAERHGGRMWVESEPGSGTAFYFAIPATMASSADS